MSRREKILALLEDSPDDVFLLYSLALEIAKDDSADAISRLGEINTQFPDYVPAYLQRGQLLANADRTGEARAVYTTGIEVARRTGDEHAAGEMTGFLELLPS